MSAALIEAIIVGGVKYGPEFVTAVIALSNKNDPTVADVEALFAGIKSYESYGIKDVAPAV